jgi:hypothetical protein
MDSFGSAFIGAMIGAIPGSLVSLVTYLLTRRSNQSLERVKTDLQQDVIQFTKWHEKRIDALVVIYTAFCDYLEFLRRALYAKRNGGISMDPMHEFRSKIERQMLYLDDSTLIRLTPKSTRFSDSPLIPSNDRNALNG